MNAIVRTSAPEVRYLSGYEVRDVDTDGRYLTATVATFDNPVDVGPFIETLRPGVFDATLARHADNIPLMVEHEHRAVPVGAPIEWDKSEVELRGVWRFGSSEQAKAAHRAADERLWGGVSVGFLPGKNPGANEWSPDRRSVVRNEARLLEVSLVAVPANPDAKVLAVRTMGAPAIDPAQQPKPHLEQARAHLAELRNKWT